jgi:hypothetical protein
MLIAILRCCASSLDDGRPTFRDQHAVSESRPPMSKWSDATSQSNEHLNYLAAKASKPSTGLILTYVLTHSLNPWCRVLLEKLNGFQEIKKIPSFCRTRGFITVFTRARHLYHEPDQSNPCTNILLNINLESMLRSPSRLFPSGFFHQKTVYTSYLRHTRYMSRPSYSRFQCPNSILCGVQQSKILIICFSSIPCHLVLLKPKYSHHPTLKHTQPTILTHRERPRFTAIKKNKIMFFYILITIILDGELEEKKFTAEW